MDDPGGTALRARSAARADAGADPGEEAGTMSRLSVEEFDVVVVGAGVGGAAFALALAHAYPLRVLLIERHPGPGKINRGDSLLPAITAHLPRWQTGSVNDCRFLRPATLLLYSRPAA